MSQSLTLEIEKQSEYESESVEIKKLETISEEQLNSYLSMNSTELLKLENSSNFISHVNDHINQTENFSNSAGKMQFDLLKNELTWGSELNYPSNSKSA